MHKKLIVEVNKRIAFKHRMAYEKEQERLRKIHEEQQQLNNSKSITKRDTPESMDPRNQSTLQSEGLNVSDISASQPSNMKMSIGESQVREVSGYSSRFEKNFKNIESAFGDSH